MGRMDQKGFTPVYAQGNDCGCDSCENTQAYTANNCPNNCDNGCDGNAYAAVRNNKGRRHGCEECNDETHVIYESCDGAKEICVTSRCQEDEALGRVLDVSTTLLNVCPGRRSALGIALTEVDENGDEYARGFRAVTVPAHNGRCNQDVQVDAVRFILPEDQSLQARRHFIVRTQHHYMDANQIWNNSWGR